jgi:anti-anti-sigma factor
MFSNTVEEKNIFQTTLFQLKSLKIRNIISQRKKSFIAYFSMRNNINSSGINLLITLLNKTQDNYGELYICNLSIALKRLIAISKLESIFEIEESRKLALQKFK